MVETVKQSVIVEKTGVFSEDLKKRYEYTMDCKGVEGKSILVICINPASDSLMIVDTTTNYLTNNLFTMGYSTITLCNLFPNITGKLQPSEIGDNVENLEFIQEVLKRDFDEILIGFGNTFNGNKKVREQKEKLNKLMKSSAKKLVEIIDKDEKYKELKTIHPLFAGQRFSGDWKFRKYELPSGKSVQRKENK